MKALADYLIKQQKRIGRMPNSKDVVEIISHHLKTTPKAYISIQQEVVTIHTTPATKNELLIHQEEINKALTLRYPHIKNIHIQ